MGRLINVNIPESITGLTDSCKILINIPEDEKIVFKLDSVFKPLMLEGRIRLPYQRPKDNCTVEIEMWYVNEELSKLFWQDLTLNNSGYLIVHYSFLNIDEKLSLQPFLWKYMIFGREWIESFTYILSCFREESKTKSDSIKNLCSEIQRKLIFECMNRTHERLVEDDDYKTNEDRKILRRVMQWWAQ